MSGRMSKRLRRVARELKNRNPGTDHYKLLKKAYSARGTIGVVSYASGVLHSNPKIETQISNVV